MGQLRVFTFVSSKHFFFFILFLFFFSVNVRMASEANNSVMLEKLTHTKKFQQMLDTKDLYAVPVSAVPGCGFLLGMLLKREGISRASDLYELFKKQNRKAFTEYLQCKLGKWNGIYVNVAIRALEDWQKLNDPKPEKKVKKEAPKKEKIPHKVGEGSKKWDAFMAREDLAKTSVRLVPGIAGVLGCELNKQGYKTAQQLMDQWQGNKKGQCNGDEAAFHKWVLCAFGFWNTQYTRVVLSALKAYGQSKGMTFEGTAEEERTANEDIADEETNANEDIADDETIAKEDIADDETIANEDIADDDTNANEDQESSLQEQDALDHQDSEKDGSEAQDDSEANQADDAQVDANAN